MNKDKFFRGAFLLVVIFGYIMGVIGGVGYTFYYDAYPVGIGIIITGVLAFPQAWSIFNEFMELTKSSN